jgi:hypothetical protein
MLVTAEFGTKVKEDVYPTKVVKRNEPREEQNLEDGDVKRDIWRTKIKVDVQPEPTVQEDDKESGPTDCPCGNCGRGAKPTAET